MSDSLEPPSDTAAPALHHTEQTRTYPCAACGGELVFDITSQLLKCPSCGSTHPISAPTGPVVERDLDGALAQARQPAAAAAPNTVSTKEIVCQNCGGHTTFDGTLTATRCPYCATPIQRDDVHDAPTRLPVDGVVPFRVDHAAAKAAIESWINGRRFAPTEFKKYGQAGSFQSVYLSYFSYDADTETTYTGQRGTRRTVTVGSEGNKRTETKTDWTHVSGEVAESFDDVPVFANDGFEADRIAQLEPWPTEEARQYSPEFVAGHLCRTYDRDVGACWADARGTMEAAIDSSIKRDIGGDEQRVDARQTTWRSTAYKHLLLPIWLLTVIYDGRPFQVYINGVTGEVVGSRPWSKAKIIAAVAAVALALLTLILLYQRFKG